MGKRYHCDYCDKTMVAAPSIVKIHIKGLVHQKLVQEHYQQFKDPETILKEEAIKKPCLRFASGQCQFGAICRFSHYTREQLIELRQYVTSKGKAEFDNRTLSFQDLYQKLQNDKCKLQDNADDKNSTTLYDSNGVTHVLPWTYNATLESYDENLPPSIKKMKLEDFKDAEIVEWG
ncbi:unnamed protein product [Diatraea saccharalis]|uniref:U1-C C2H2-type zinc finger domain-containing protein n=1 Tax=Diatraea saccharalis TaxID=40085 RepID=A0A9N9R5X8_9NEOP|nr:unnamed protein product [Diatraea saccharalis]